MNPDEVERAAARIEGLVRRTPVLEVEAGSLAASPVVLKLELFQHAGSFKPRGAFNNALSAPIPDAGIVAASGGNFGLAVAHVAASLDVPAEIFVPEGSPAAKVERLRAFGGRVTVRVGGAYYDEAQAAADIRVAESGARRLHPYDQPETVSGQGTVARELEDQVGSVDTVLVACGGGGLIAGVAAWYGSRVRVVGVEPEGCPCLHDALVSDAPVDAPVGGLASDSLGARRLGAVPWSVLRGVVERCVLVTEDAIRVAQRRLWATTHVVAEPGGAAALAALTSGAYAADPGERVVAIVCGANTDPATVA